MHAGLKIHAKLYPSTGFHDELAWAAVWLYKATMDPTYLTAAVNTFEASQQDSNVACCHYGTFSWDTKSPGAPLSPAALLAPFIACAWPPGMHVHAVPAAVLACALLW
jgi:hypothetical protein